MEVDYPSLTESKESGTDALLRAGEHTDGGSMESPMQIDQGQSHTPA